MVSTGGRKGESEGREGVRKGGVRGRGREGEKETVRSLCLRLTSFAMLPWAPTTSSIYKRKGRKREGE